MIRIQNIRIAGILLLLAGFMPSATAQVAIGARGVALGNATTAVNNYEWALFSNPALLSVDKKKMGFYALRYYGIAELTDISSFFSLPTKVGVAAVGLHRYGGDSYSETRIRAAYKNAWKLFHVGVLVNYNHITFGGGEYGSGGALTMDIGVAAQLSSNLWLGAKAANTNQGSYQFEAYDEALYQDLSLGLSYQLADKALFSLDMVKDVRFPVSWRGGIEMQVVDRLVGRVGITTEPVTYSFGLGYELDVWSINLAMQQHRELGASPGLDITLKL